MTETKLIGYLVLAVIPVIITYTILYYVIKGAVKDALKETEMTIKENKDK